MSITLNLMGRTKAPSRKGAKPGPKKGGAKKSAGRAKSSAKTKRAAKGSSSNPYVFNLSPAKFLARIARGRSTHNSLQKKAIGPLPTNVYAKARAYYHSSRRKHPKLRIYDKLRLRQYRKFVKSKWGTTNTAMYKHGFKAGRRPRARVRQKPKVYSVAGGKSGLKKRRAGGKKK